MISPFVTFTVSVTGDSVISGMLQERLREKYPNIEIFDRDEEARLAESGEDEMFIPQVAYMDILFSKNGDADITVIRCFHQHRLFNYDMSQVEPGSRNETDMLDKMMAAVENLWTLPKENPIQRYVPPEEDDDSVAVAGDEQADLSMDASSQATQQETEENNV